jgi:serine protease Do
MRPFHLSRRSALPCAASLLLAGLVVFGSSPVAAQKPVPQPQSVRPEDALVNWNASIDALTKKVWPSVVQILVTGYGTRPPARGETAVVGQQRSVGSGFVIDAEGYILTNAHVVDGAQRVQVVLPAPGADGTLASALSSKMNVVPARIVGITTEIDLAVLKIDVKVPALPLATYSQVRQGEIVFAFGSPSGLRNTLTHGLVSAVARQIDPDSPLIYVQTDASINPGNSGGPLVNARGEVVGVNTFILSQTGGSDGLSFAIPVATARTVFRQIRQYGQLRRQEVGISTQTITPDMAAALGLSRDYGVIVSDVWPGGPAETAGLKIGDVLVSVDDQPADNLPSVNYFFRLRDSTERVRIVVLRGTAQFVFQVATVEERSELDSVTPAADPEVNMVRELGILGVEIDARIAAVAKGLRAPNGVIVVARVAGTSGEVPLLVRDVIRSVNNQPVTTLQGLRDTVRALKPGTPVAMQIQREGRLMYLTFTLN